MLDTVYMQILDMSKTASIVILAVLLMRLILKKAPKVFSYALWAVVLFRLLCPFSIETPVSVVPEMPSVSQDYTLSEEPISVAEAGMAAYRAVGDALNGGLGVQHIQTTEKDETGMTRYVTTDWWSVWILFGQYVWVAGIFGMLLYSAVSYLKVRKKLLVVVPLRDNIFVADDIKSPFVVGLFRPKIYLPCNLGEKEQEYIILHEQHHIKRLDHVVKALAFLALTIHWFNPLVWLAFVLASKDMEMSCDEAVMGKLGGDVRADYSASLLTLATGRRIIAGTPLAFGEGDTKGRIKNLAKWKKPAVWVVILSVVACIALTACLTTDPKAEEPSQESPENPAAESFNIAGRRFVYEKDGFMGDFTITLNENGTFSYYEGPLSSYLGFGTWTREGNLLTLTDTGGYPFVNRFLIDGKMLIFVAEGSTNFLYVKVQDGERFFVSDAEQQKDTIVSITDPTKDGEFAYDDALEKFFEDEVNEYFFSGIYSQYVIVHYADGTSEDIVSALNSGRATIADLDRFGVRYRAEPKPVDLSAAIISAIIDHYRSADPTGLYNCASFTLLMQEELCFDSDPPLPNQVTVYGIALYQAYSFYEGVIREIQGHHGAVALTFEVQDGSYRLLEYWEPQDEEDIRNKFPDEIEDKAMDQSQYLLQQKQSCYKQAAAYSGLDVNAAIEQLLAVIESSPLHSSRPGDYIDAHPVEYQELLWYGDYTLQYIFSKFLEGDQIGLRGHIMRALLDDLAPEAQLRLYAMTGQDYFDEWMAGAIRISEQHDMNWIEENQPAVRLLLRMIGK